MEVPTTESAACNYAQRRRDTKGNKSMQTRENENQIRGEERKKDSEIDRHTML